MQRAALPRSSLISHWRAARADVWLLAGGQRPVASSRSEIPA
ncbi:MAG TPA: hypothetical protein PKE27_10565 [Povalibacter sp.]|nr:hypothetical protein [Povalibacter sp.]HMN45009.1 hypothetical protein [Povalibacter sp.]